MLAHRLGTCYRLVACDRSPTPRRPPVRPCLTCGTPTRRGSHCPTCQQAKDRGRNTRRTWYHGTWQQLSRTTREAWIAEHGMTCPGLNDGPHPATTLQLDHTTGQVLCPKHNTAAGPAGPTATIPH